MQKILEELWGSRGEVQKSSGNYWFLEEGCCVKSIVLERARLTAVTQCSVVCEATALAKRSGGQRSRQRNAADRSVVSSFVWWYFARTPLRHVSKQTSKQANKQTSKQANKQTNERTNEQTNKPHTTHSMRHQQRHKNQTGVAVLSVPLCVVDPRSRGALCPKFSG